MKTNQRFNTAVLRQQPTKLTPWGKWSLTCWARAYGHNHEGWSGRTPPHHAP